VSFGPIFALIFVLLLRTKLIREKRKAFILLLFVVTTMGILILMLFARDGRWIVLDLLSICISWCAVVSYIIVDELRVTTASVIDYDDQTGDSQQSQRGQDESTEGVNSQLEAGRVSVQSVGMFTIGDEST